MFRRSSWTVLAPTLAALVGLAGGARAQSPDPSPTPTATPALTETKAATAAEPEGKKETPPPQAPSAAGKAATGASQEDTSRFSEEPIPLVKLPARPGPLAELGAPFLKTGPLSKGFTLPGGATWQPAFLAWGVLRSGVHVVDQGNGAQSAAWGNRLDLFGQLGLTPTERFVVSFRPLDQNGQFTGYTFSPVHSEVNAFNSAVTTLYFEGDFGELFPNLDKRDTKALDYGFAVGRIPVFFQEGMLINDAMDGVGLVRNSLRPMKSWANLRITGLLSWGQINRGGNNVIDPSANLVGLFTEFDTPTSTVDVDAVYIDASKGTGSGLYGGISSAQRLSGWLNSTFRVLGSRAIDLRTSSVASGVLLFSALSFTPKSTDDVAYLDLYWALDNYTAAARDAGLGGPLDRVGILYEGVGLGTGYGNVLSNQSKDSFGGAIGYQKFLNRTRTQIIFELGGQKGTVAANRLGQIAGAVRLQQALGRRVIARVEGFALGRESLAPNYGARCEFLVKF